MRKDRIASVLIRAISDIIEHEIKDPRLGLVTITTVDVTSDLKKATVYFSSLNDKDAGFATLNRAKGFIRTALAGRVRMKYIPEIEFKIDNSFEYGERIDALINKISKDNKDQ
jgi:ribosome-binding factor A